MELPAGLVVEVAGAAFSPFWLRRISALIWVRSQPVRTGFSPLRSGPSSPCGPNR